MTVAKKKTKTKNFMVYFKTALEHSRMKLAAAKDQSNPRPNLTEYARKAIRERVERDLGA